MTFRINLWGDLTLQRRLSRCTDQRFLALKEVLSQGALSIANLEGCIQNGEDWPASFGSRVSMHLDVPPWVTDELTALGFQAVFTANNKVSDFGEGGILTTLEYLDRAGIHHAGSGANLTQATAPTYLDTRMGRVALMGAADNGIRDRGAVPAPSPVGCVAADGGPWYPDRPGVNMLCYEPTYFVDAQALDEMRRVSELLGWEDEKQANRWKDDRVDNEESFWFHGSRFAIGEDFRFATTADSVDLTRNCKWISDARRNAELVIVGLHQNGAVWREGLPNADDPPADHALEFAHKAIDAGADIFVVHGSGRGGVEFYEDGVIIYGVAGFNPHHARVRIPREEFLRLGLSDSDTPADLTATMVRGRETYNPVDDSQSSFSGAGRLPIGGRDVLHTVVIDDDFRISQVIVHPLRVVRGGSSGAGTPVLATPGDEIHRQALKRLHEACQVFGTHVKEVDGVGIIERP